MARRRFTPQAGFTLIELLVVMGITALLSGLLILTTGVGRSHVLLSIEGAKIAQVVARARSLSVLTASDPVTPCGYGVHMRYAENAYALFRYDVPDCSAISFIDRSNPAQYEELERFELQGGIAFVRGSEPFDEIFFIPPDPKVRLWSDGALAEAAKIGLQSPGGRATLTLIINDAGQVDF